MRLILTGENVGLFTLLLVFGFLGVRACLNLWRRVFYNYESRRHPVLILLTVIANIITIAALYFGVMSFRRLLGFPPFDWAPTISALVASIIFLLPPLIEYVVARIARSKEGLPTHVPETVISKK